MKDKVYYVFELTIEEKDLPKDWRDINAKDAIGRGLKAATITNHHKVEICGHCGDWKKSGIPQTSPDQDWH